MGFDYAPPSRRPRVKSVAALRCLRELDKLDLKFNRITTFLRCRAYQVARAGGGGNDGGSIAPMIGMTGLQSLWLF
jgi:hypothetical protein